MQKPGKPYYSFSQYRAWDVVNDRDDEGFEDTSLFGTETNSRIPSK